MTKDAATIHLLARKSKRRPKAQGGRIQLSLHADFACRVLIFLAAASEGRSSIDEIAAAFKISEHHLVKVVHRLGKLGFVETARGRGGGIRLARPATEISMGDVIRRMEQPGFSVVECFDARTNRCPIAGPCGLKPWLARAMESFLFTLDGVTLADATTNQNQIRNSLYR